MEVIFIKWINCCTSSYRRAFEEIYELISKSTYIQLWHEYLTFNRSPLSNIINTTNKHIQSKIIKPEVSGDKSLPIRG